MKPQVKHDTLLVQRACTSHDPDFRVVPIPQLQDAIDYIIHYNPMIVIVDKSMTDAKLLRIRQSVQPWFSGKIIQNSEQ